MRATISVLKPGAPNCFYVITSAENLTDADRARLAQRDGNEHIESPVRYDVMMEEDGFTDVELVDVTPQYSETLKAWKREWEADADAIIELIGGEEFARRMRNRSLDIAHAADGLLFRYRVFGIKPQPV